MAFLLPPEEIVYYYYQLQQDRAHDAQRATITVGVTAHSAVMPTVIGLAACNAWARAKHFGCHSVITLAAAGE